MHTHSHTHTHTHSHTYTHTFTHTHTDVSGTFLLTTLGQQATIECAFSKVVSNVEWLGPPLEGSQIIRSSARNRISMTIHVRVEHHSQSLMCRGVDHNGEFVYIPYLIIVHSECVRMIV